jgi:hypothetical protein
MKAFLSNPSRVWFVILFGSLAANVFAAMEPIVPKWGRFEQSFDSGVKYENPIQEATLTVIFMSPLGDTNRVYGFWDGGKTWRVRFSPNTPGQVGLGDDLFRHFE